MNTWCQEDIENKDKPASPTIHMPTKENGNYRNDDTAVTKYRGLTKREHFAGLAMQGILAHSFGRGDADELAAQSIKCADALLRELAK